MKVMVIGGGGREHAIIKKIKENKNVTELYALPGNGGIAKDATCIDIGAKDIEGIVNFARNAKIDFAVVAPDDPLVLGCVDALTAIGVKCFGPEKKAAIIEGSKVFSKNLMKKYQIPTAKFEVFEKLENAEKYIESFGEENTKLVVKADGLALGKGVLICDTLSQAKLAVKQMMSDKVFGESGSTVVIEEFLEGPEVSVLAFTDGNVVVPMVSSMDHKRAKDGDNGLNTGGMGTVAPNPYYTKDIAEICMQTIFIPTIKAMNAENRMFKGCLYFGLMLTKDGAKVIEYNCRFGDPETQVVLPLLESDLLDVMIAVTDGNLNQVDVEFSKKAACCVIMASDGYPEHYEKGFEIKVKSNFEGQLYVAGAKLTDKKLMTNGGRVLGVTAVGENLKQAVENAYKEVEKVSFDNAFFRHDIGKKALMA